MKCDFLFCFIKTNRENPRLYYRGHPHEEHGEGCMYTLKEIVIKDVEKIGGDIEKQAVSQLDMLLRSMVDNNQKPDTTKTGNSGQDCRDIPVVHRQQTLQKRLPQCRLELLPELLAANEAPREVNIYYGRVLCEVVSDKTPYKGADVKVLVVKDIVTKKVIMGLTMSLAVWSHFTTDTQALLQAAQQPLHIAFLGSPSSLQTQKLKLSHSLSPARRSLWWMFPSIGLSVLLQFITAVRNLFNYERVAPCVQSMPED